MSPDRRSPCPPGPSRLAAGRTGSWTASRWRCGPQCWPGRDRGARGLGRGGRAAREGPDPRGGCGLVAGPPAPTGERRVRFVPTVRKRGRERRRRPASGSLGHFPQVRLLPLPPDGWVARAGMASGLENRYGRRLSGGSIPSPLRRSLAARRKERRVPDPEVQVRVPPAGAPVALAGLVRLVILTRCRRGSGGGFYAKCDGCQLSGSLPPAGADRGRERGAPLGRRGVRSRLVPLG